MKQLYLLLIMIVLTHAPAIYSEEGDLRADLDKLVQLQGESFTKNVRYFYDSLKYVSDYQSKMNAADQLFEITLKTDERAHLHSLLFRAMHSGKNETGLFRQAYNIAEKYHSIDDINNVEFSRARYFMASKQYDSAMIYLLRYRDQMPPDERGEGYRDIINLMGDLYYHAGIYDQARKVFLDLFRQYEADAEWDYFRPYVMMNNLGQIAIMLGEPKEARKWFEKSLKLAEQKLHTPFRYNTMGYTKIKLAETALISDSLQVAEQHLNAVAAYPADAIYEDVRQEWIFIKARLLLKQGKLDEALALAKQLLPDDSLRFSEYRFIPEIYRLFAGIFTQKKDFTRALEFSTKYNHIEDSLQAQKHVAGSLVILAEYNQELTKIELQRSRQRNFILLSGLFALVVILVVILLFYRKLYRSKLELVRKSLENEPRDEMSSSENGQNRTTDVVDDVELMQQKQLIKQLKELMENQKPYLNPGLTIVEVAKQLSTNRTYLSRAINQQLKTTFPNFTNEYRIRESIRMITSGYTTNRTQEALARQSGFANRNVFTTAFKKSTGVVPSFFIANYKKWDQQNNRFNHDF